MEEPGGEQGGLDPGLEVEAVGVAPAQLLPFFYEPFRSELHILSWSPYELKVRVAAVGDEGEGRVDVAAPSPLAHSVRLQYSECMLNLFVGDEVESKLLPQECRYVEN